MSKLKIEATIDVGEIETTTLVNVLINRLKQHNKGWKDAQIKQPMEQWSEERIAKLSKYKKLKNRIKKVCSE